jgi:hypothetical protein
LSTGDLFRREVELGTVQVSYHFQGKNFLKCFNLCVGARFCIAQVNSAAFPDVF